MAIIITKKRHVPETRPADPLVDDTLPSPAQAAPPPSKFPATSDTRPMAATLAQVWDGGGAYQPPPAIDCTRCGKPSPFPCNGEDDMCAKGFAVTMKENIARSRAHEGV